jgi:phage tail-like protein
MTSHAPERLAQAAGPIAPARFSITIDGYEIASFSELLGLTSGIDPAELTLGVDKKDKLVLKAPAKRRPPAVILKRAKTADLALFTWHSDALSSSASGRRDAELVFFDAEGRKQSRYHLTDAWPAKIEIGSLMAGSPEVLMETVTIVCDRLERVAP